MKIENEEIYVPAIIADSFNTYFTNIGSNLAAKIPHSEKHFTEYLNQSEVVMTEKELTSEEFESAFKTLKTNKSKAGFPLEFFYERAEYSARFFPLEIKNHDFHSRVSIFHL